MKRLQPLWCDGVEKDVIHSLLDIEPRLRRVKGHRHLPKLKTALRRALNIKEQQTHEWKVTLINRLGAYEKGVGADWRRRTD